MRDPHKVLVFRTGHLGDTVCAIPAFRLIRQTFPNAELTLLCDRPGRSVLVPAAEVTKDLGIFDRIESYRSSGAFFSGAWQIFKAVRKIKPDLVIGLPQVRESNGNVRQKRKFFRRCGVADVRVVQISTFAHEWQPNEPNRLLEILDSVGFQGPKPDYAIPANSHAQLSLTQKLRAAEIREDVPMIVFCGGGKASTQCWALDRYAAVLTQIANDIDVEIVGIGTAQEIDSYRREILPLFNDLSILAEPLTIPEMFEVFRGAYCYLGNDTGPMHVAAAMSCPVIALVSARNAPGSWDPDTPDSLVIRHRTECEDCFLIDCVAEKHRCMTAISVQEVVNRSFPFLKQLTKGKERMAKG